MKVGDLVKWSWHLGTGWEPTHCMGVIVGFELYNQATPEIRVFDVFLTDGTMCEVSENEEGLEWVA